ncbi:TPA: hypothetical protein KQG29_001552 [Clostridioides difficile]|nr:hypothetical protein [Clostridioides difficile]
MKIKAIGLSMIILLSLGTTACKSNIEKTDSLSLEEVAGRRLAQKSEDEKDSIIYNLVRDRITVDKSNLLKISSKDMLAIRSCLENVDRNLKGADNEALSFDYSNYLLTEFAKTPFEWEQYKVNEVGYDPATRLYFVDVKYKTTNSLKSVIPSSAIPSGSASEEAKKKQRAEDYQNILDLKNSGSAEADTKLQEFIATWGEPDKIQAEQQGVSLMERTRKLSSSTGGIGRLTYSGLLADTNLNVGATLTIRYVFNYRHNLGEETDMTVKALYLKDYELSSSDAILSQYSNKDNTGIEILKPFVDKLILSYNKAIEETNHVGLFKLFEDYAGIDKYCDDLSNYTYTNFNGYTYKILEKKGDTLVVKVDRITKSRAKGTKMSFPTYQETLIFNLALSNDDSLKIKSVYPIKSKMVGEPLSVIEDVSGVSDMINYSRNSFTDENEKAVKDTLKKFSKAVFKADVSSEDFTQVVDMGISQTVLQKIAETVTSIKADKKTTYIISWDTKTNGFVTVRLREIFETKDNNYDTEATVDIASTDSGWKIVDYNRTLNVKTDKSDFSKKNALCIDKKE